MIEDKVKIEGRLKAFSEDGKKLLDTKNHILDVGLDYIVKILGTSYTGSEIWYNDTTSEEYGIESVAVGDDNTTASDDDTDLIGSQVNEGLVDRDDDGYGLLETGRFSFVFPVSNNSGSDEIHWEAVITNNGGVSKGDRICMSRIPFDNEVILPDGEEIKYTWELILSR